MASRHILKQLQRRRPFLDSIKSRRTISSASLVCAGQYVPKVVALQQTQTPFSLNHRSSAAPTRRWLSSEPTKEEQLEAQVKELREAEKTRKMVAREVEAASQSAIKLLAKSLADVSDRLTRSLEESAPKEAESAKHNALLEKNAGTDGEDKFTKARGWSMQEAMTQAKKEKRHAKAMQPAQVLESLQQGNSRFWTGSSTRPEVSAFERRVLIAKQFPMVAILGCSDSRVPVEIVFDQGLGDMFVVRTAGNSLGVTTTASLEYAVHHLNVKVLLIMGHEGCGAVNSARMPIEAIEKLPEALASLLKNIKDGLDEPTLSALQDARVRDREAGTCNVRRQVERICRDETIMAKIKEEKLIVVGAFYELSSGIVDFFHEVLSKGDDDSDDLKPSVGVQSRYFPDTGKVVSG
jgi:carbonic anhydrase